MPRKRTAGYMVLREGKPMSTFVTREGRVLLAWGHGAHLFATRAEADKAINDTFKDYEECKIGEWKRFEIIRLVQGWSRAEAFADEAAFLAEPWQAIETAPTDGSVKSMLLLVEHRFLPHLNKQPETAYAIGMLHNEEWYSPTGGKPIAWMPLPAPPSTKGSE